MVPFLDILPERSVIINSKQEIMACNKAALSFFACADTQQFVREYYNVLPKAQGAKAVSLADMVKQAFELGQYEAEWLYESKAGEQILMDARLTRFSPSKNHADEYVLLLLHIHGAEARAAGKIELASALKAIVDATPLALNLWDSQMNNIICNQQVLNLFGIKTQEEYLSNFYRFSPEYQPNGELSSDMSRKNMEIAMRDGYHRFHWMHLDYNGQELPAEITLTKIQIAEGEDHIAGFVNDLRPSFGQEEEGTDDYYFLDRIPEKVFLNKVAELSEDLLFAVDLRTANIRFLNLAMQSSLQTEPESDGGSYLKSTAFNLAHVHEDDVHIYKELLRNINKGIVKPLEMRFLQADGRYKHYRALYRFINNKNGKPIIVVGKGVDITAQKMLEEKSKLDSLTQCYSRVNIEAMITKRLNTCGDGCGAMLLVDIGSFKQFNEQHGHYHGDELLRQLAGRLKEWCTADDMVGRIGGDEFVVYMRNTRDNAAFSARLDDLAERINKEYHVLNLNTTVKISIGAVQCQGDCETYQQGLACADKALLAEQQRGGGGWSLYNRAYKYSSTHAHTSKIKGEKISGLNTDHTITAAIFNILHERNNDSTSIASALNYLGQSYSASRCFIAETFDDGITYTITHRWNRPGLPLYMQVGESVPASNLANLFANVSANGMFVCNDVSNINFGGALPSLLKEACTKAFLHAQSIKNNAVSFFIGIEDCEKTREWSDAEINTLQYISRVFGIVLQGNYLHEEIKFLSAHSKVSAFIGDNTDNFIYIVDPDTYQLLHMNKKALEMYGSPSEDVWRTKKCYELLHEKTEPCEFCTNSRTTEHVFYEWQYYNPRFNKTYLFKDKLVPLNGKLVKLQVATDITHLVALESELTSKLEEQTLLLNCIRMLHTNDTPDVSIEQILRNVGEFFGASRGMIFQISPDRLTVDAPYEWVAAQGHLHRMTLKDIPIEGMQPFFKKFSQLDKISSGEIIEIASDDTALAHTMKERGISSFVCAPITDAEENFIGMLMLVSPQANSDKHWLLGSLSVFVSDFLRKNTLVASLNKLSYYDTLTGAKNRHSYRKALQELDDTPISSLGVAYVDISGLAKVNEERGTLYGDELIKSMAKILTELFGEDIFRVGGDEFVVLKTNIEELAFESKMRSLNAAIETIPDLRASIGFTWNTNFDDSEDQSKTYTTIRDSKNYTAMLSKNLESEINSGKYVVYLQPQINFATGTLDGAEALIRRVDASGNIQTPAAFVPFYEKEGMISAIDLHVFKTVCRQLNLWQQQGIGENIKISVNFSRSTVMEKNLVGKLAAICEEHGVSRSRFVVEITETMSHVDDMYFAQVITSLKDAGFCVSLDDFGSGYSNLSALKISNFDEIKIDMGLTKNVHTDQKSKILTKVALNLCDEFEGMISVAEGIETIEQYNVLKVLNCHKGQGYYFSRPICIEDFERRYFNRPN